MSSAFIPVPVEPDDRAGLLFFQALQQPPELRAAFLGTACGEDPALRAEVDSLLRDHARAGHFLTGITERIPAVETGSGPFQAEQTGYRIGPYKLMEQLGEGGFGVVWVAEQEVPVRRLLALKILKPGMDTKEVIGRFEQERQALAMMDHPNIAKILDAGSTALGRPFFVMELVRGIKITTYCDEANLPTSERLRLFIAVCHAVQHAHQKGIIHRDLKPSNILVTLHDGVPVPKVIDFGVAKATQRQRLTDRTIYTQFEQMLGTPLYMSPEQAEMSGLDIDTRSDIYSLGVLLYELLAGRTPFDPESLMQRGVDEIRRAVLEQEPQKPSAFVSTLALDRRTTLAKHRQTDSAKLVGQIRGDLDWIVMKALEKDRTRRYETADNFAQDLQRHLDCEPVQARPPTAGYRFRRFARRNKGVFAAGTGIAAALVAGTAISTWHSLRADREAARANQEAARATGALSDLRASAPAFASMAQTLAAEGNFDEAVRKLDIAITLRPDLIEHVITKADLLQSQLRFAEAEPLYREALRLDPGDKRARDNARLCGTLAAETAEQSNLSRKSLLALFNTMTAEQRPAAQLMQIGKLLGNETNLLIPYWLDRLKNLPIPPDRTLEQRLTADVTGRLTLDLSGTDVLDLSPLTGMPVDRLILSGCEKITDLGPLRGMPLRELTLGWMERDQHLASYLRRKPCQVVDLSPLQGMSLARLDLDGTKVTDLSALRGMPLEELELSRTGISDLSPLHGMPLTFFGGTAIPAIDFSPLAGAPLIDLSLQFTNVEDLSFLRDMPLESLFLNGCDRARGFHVLSSLKQLAVLWLPKDYADLPPADLSAIESLRQHPALRQLAADPEVISSHTTPLKEEFWKEFDRDQQSRGTLLRMAEGEKSRFRKEGQTWIVNLGGTKITDLQPLTGHGLKDLYLFGCQAGLDLAPLAGIATLETLVLPPDPKNIEALRKLPRLKYLSFDYVPETSRSRRWWQTAEQFWSDFPVETLARAGKFAEAEALLRKQIKASISTDWLGLGAVVLAQRDDTRFKAVCHEMMTHLKKVDPPTAARIALLSPDPGIATAGITTLMEKVRAQKPHTGDNYYIMIEGIDDYRAGRHETAIELLNPLVNGRAFPGWTAAAAVIVSMSYHKIGKPGDSNRIHAFAKAITAANWPRRTDRGTWQEWLIAHLLLQEAGKVMATPAGPSASK